MSDHIIYGAKVSEKTMLNSSQSLGKYLTDACKEHSNELFMVDAETEKWVTYKDVFERSQRISQFLVDSGYTCGSVVGIVVENSFEYPSLLIAVLNVGAICTCINPLYSKNELLHVFNISKPSIIFTSSKLYGKIMDVQKECTSIKRVVNMDEVVFPKSNNFQYNDIDKIDSTDTATILYSSGTTGMSKGVMQSHKAWIFFLEIFRTEKLVSFRRNNVVSGLLPMSHTYGLFTLLMSLVLGHRYVLIKRYHENLFLSYVEKFKINTLYIVPSVAIFLAKTTMIEEHDMSSVALIASGGGYINNEVITSVRKRFECDFFSHYGMTETTGCALYALSSPKIGVTGHLMPGMMAKVVDTETECIQKPFENGEICLKGPILFNGYLGAGAKDNVLDREGWFHTGDIGYYDSDNDFYIVERLKELIKYKGYQVPPAELEMLILQHPDVIAVVVVGVPDEVAGELPRAYVVKKRNSNVTEDEIIQFVASNISPMKKLRAGVRFVDHLPQTSTGKVDRKEIKQWVVAGL